MISTLRKRAAAGQDRDRLLADIAAAVARFDSILDEARLGSAVQQTVSGPRLELEDLYWEVAEAPTSGQTSGEASARPIHYAGSIAHGLAAYPVGVDICPRTGTIVLCAGPDGAVHFLGQDGASASAPLPMGNPRMARFDTRGRALVLDRKTRQIIPLDQHLHPARAIDTTPAHGPDFAPLRFDLDGEKALVLSTDSSNVQATWKTLDIGTGQTGYQAMPALGSGTFSDCIFEAGSIYAATRSPGAILRFEPGADTPQVFWSPPIPADTQALAYGLGFFFVLSAQALHVVDAKGTTRFAARVATLTGAPTSSPLDLALSADGTTLCVTDAMRQCVHLFRVDCGALPPA